MENRELLTSAKPLAIADYAFVVLCESVGFDKYTGKPLSKPQKFACQNLGRSIITLSKIH